MFVTKAALPFLHAMAPGLSDKSAKFTPRLGFVYKRYGNHSPGICEPKPSATERASTGRAHDRQMWRCSSSLIT
jgi:hypothetical protein